MKIHFMGIAGSGASAAASIAESQGFEVKGCDLEPKNEFTKQFKSDQLQKGHSPGHLYCHSERREGSNSKLDSSASPQNDNLVDFLAISPAVTSLDPDNPELIEARKLGIEILTWQEFMGKYLQKDKFVIAVCGTHGKSTVTAMIGELLEDGGLDPTVMLGAIVPKWGTNYRIGKGKYFVVEADEFNDNFLTTKPDISVVTNMEMDHPEYFKDIKAVKKSFEKFLLGTKHAVVANLSDPSVAEVLKIVMKAPRQISHDREVIVQYLNYSKNEFNLSLKIPGEYNRLNAKDAFQVGLLLKIDTGHIRKSLENFTGVGRRFEHLGNYKGREVYSDFGHHPTEIKVTMEAAREKFPNQHIWLIYEPHMFTRTRVLFKDFVEVFKNLPVNQILILDIYSSREKDTGLVSSQELVDAVDKSNIDYVSNEDLKKIIDSDTHPRDILFFMGAGDIDKIARDLLSSV